MAAPGVSATTGAMGSLLGKLATLLGDEYKLLKRVRKEIQFLERELSRIQAFLLKLADIEKLDVLVKNRRDSLRDLSYEMEDCIDRFMDQLGSGDAKRGFMKRTACRLRTIWARHDIGTLIRDLKARVVEESERNARYKLDDSCNIPTKIVEIDPRITSLHEEVRGLVAMDGPMKHVTALLIDEKEMELKVVAIVGSGGLGKTTLAMEVYRKIGASFECGASVSVSRTPDLEKLLKDILSQIDKDTYRECQSESWGIEQLIPRIKQILSRKRYLIVIDDVWKEQDWNLIKAAFPDNNIGSRIIATTRIIVVAKLCCSNSGGHPYQMPPLDDVDSRRLFFKRIFRSDDPCPAELEEVSARILKKCGGLPLAIITFASLLASRTHNKDEWERLQDSIGTDSLTENDGNLKAMNDILLLSYWDLPHHLKSCLLYLCIYPEDYKINCGELKLKWIAEGFLATHWGRLDQVAHNCFNDLVNRNLIQPIIEYDGSMKYCRVHDMVLDLMIALSHEESFATISNGRIRNSFPVKIRRLSLQFSRNGHIGAVGAITDNKLHVRSLTTFHPVKQILCLMGFHALRVLDIKGYWLENKQVKNIGSSRQLRYLRIGSLKITELPEEIGKLQHLETLDLRECYKVLRLPSTVVRLQKLVHLFVGYGTQLPADEFGSLQALETLDTLHICKTDNPMKFAEELGHLTNLRKLYINTRGVLGRSRGILAASVSKLGNLRSLSIDGQEMCQRLFGDPCCTYPYLQDLTICPDMVPKGMVPKGMASLSDLVKLCISVSKFDKEGLHILMGMPSLAHLELNIVQPIKEKLTVCSNGFRLLKVFHYKYSSVCKVDATDGLCVTFAAGSVPALRGLRLEVNAMTMASNFIAELGVEHLPGPAHLQVEIYCWEAAPGRVEAMESSIEKATLLHPNREIRVITHNKSNMYKDDKEWEEAVAKERMEREEFIEKLRKTRKAWRKNES